MAHPSDNVRDPMTEEETFFSRPDSHQSPRAYEALTGFAYQLSPSQAMMARTSMSPTKSSFAPSDTARPSPRSRDQKQVTFELLLQSPQSRARLPMRVMISRHDTTDSIITTVKNFYGLYEGPGISFQDREGNILIAAYDNFDAGMTVYVKVPEELPLITSTSAPTPVSTSPKRPKLAPPIDMRPPLKHAGFSSTERSPSPSSRDTSQAAMNAMLSKSRSRSFKADPANDPSGDQFSDSDGGNGSVASSRRSRADALASADISVDNIVEGGRRKRAKFESCELPLFVPPQVPVTTSLSSVSPQRRLQGEAASPLPITNPRTFAYPLPSPQSFGRSDASWGLNGYHGGGIAQSPHQQTGPQLRARPPVNYQGARRSGGGILPTPDPTVGSVISDEDVALQLMRLGDMANMSHGRTSTSTVDDALSGKADAASSEEESEDDEEGLSLPGPRYPTTHSHAAGPRRKKLRMDPECDSCDEDHDDASFRGHSDEVVGDDSTLARRSSKPQLAKSHSSGSISGSSKDIKTKSSKLATKTGQETGGARKTSLTSIAPQLGPDEEDLSSRPRCQRCRKSKKGCDRQRPCGRCKDAGIGIEGCISEDEGNGRRGRYGRHMGVVIKKESKEMLPMAAAPPPPESFPGTFLTPAIPLDKIKKRKRSA